MESAVHESTIDVIDESRGLHMNGLLLLLLLLLFPFSLRLLPQPMFCRLWLPLQRLWLLQCSVPGLNHLPLELPFSVLRRLVRPFFLTVGMSLLLRHQLQMTSSAPQIRPRRGSRPNSAYCSAAS